MHLKVLTVLAAVGTAMAQRPANMSICDFYTTALLEENTAANQYTLLTLVVNTAVIGNYTMPNVGIAVPGILAPGMYEGTEVNLLPYFNGGLASSNRGGSAGVAINFLDDGGAVPKLLTHLYQYFGVLLGCSLEGTGDSFPAYSGQGSQYRVHKFMNLSPAEVGYFITQVGLSAASFGVATEDVTAVGQALASLFNYRCAPPTTVVPSQGPQLQAICIEDTCPLSENATCASYERSTEPLVANATLAMGEGMNGTSTTNASATVSSMSTPAPTQLMAAGARFAVRGSLSLAVAVVLGTALMACVAL
ncbi:hypothetical protein MMC24_004664 [Lignoscripta atroalba]|nr:hypothetical protein [Lignoscripta atroalba]